MQQSFYQALTRKSSVTAITVDKGGIPFLSQEPRPYLLQQGMKTEHLPIALAGKRHVPKLQIPPLRAQVMAFPGAMENHRHKNSGSDNLGELCVLAETLTLSMYSRPTTGLIIFKLAVCWSAGPREWW